MAWIILNPHINLDRFFEISPLTNINGFSFLGWFLFHQAAVPGNFGGNRGVVQSKQRLNRPFMRHKYAVQSKSTRTKHQPGWNDANWLLVSSINIPLEVTWIKSLLLMLPHKSHIYLYALVYKCKYVHCWLQYSTLCHSVYGLQKGSSRKITMKSKW